MDKLDFMEIITIHIKVQMDSIQIMVVIIVLVIPRIIISRPTEELISVVKAITGVLDKNMRSIRSCSFFSLCSHSLSI